MYLKIFQKQYSIRQIDLGRGGGEGRGEEGGGVWGVGADPINSVFCLKFTFLPKPEMQKSSVSWHRAFDKPRNKCPHQCPTLKQEIYWIPYTSLLQACDDG